MFSKLISEQDKQNKERSIVLLLMILHEKQTKRSCGVPLKILSNSGDLQSPVFINSVIPMGFQFGSKSTALSE